MSDYKIKIIHLYPNLLDLHGDKGNIECIRKRLLWRGIDAEVVSFTDLNEKIDFSDADIVFLGGGSDKEQELVCSKLRTERAPLLDFIEKGGSLLALCGGYQMLGKYYCTAEKKIEGLGLLDIYSEVSPNRTRLMGNASIQCEGIKLSVVGFENHMGVTNIGGYTPLGKVIKGFGNDGKSGFEGIVYKNLIGTYIHGPLLPQNPELCDRILLTAVKKKYPEFEGFITLDDELEKNANQYSAQ